ncbi:hypothetical protein [Lacihabitans lacunae]|uniref:Outer membrane protein beta-barrel domain-containing protein n=1 Tax=Lacihabitans lacunae TaxID=1028214 RepID=A0ABV7YQZ3_9BACT
MKKVTAFLTLIFLTNFVFGQVEGTKEISKSDAEAVGNIKTKGIKYGISFGFNRAFDKLYDARISPIDTTLLLQKTSNVSFLLSTSVSFPILKGVFGGKYYRKLDLAGNPIGDPYFVPTGLSVISSLNLVTFNSALGGAGLFNQKLDGGLGLGYIFGENVQIAITYEMISFRQPRDFLKNYDGKVIKVNNQNLSSLAIDNNDYFIDKYIPSASFKVVYILN